MWPRVQKVLRHPIMVMVVLILLCRVVKNAYPFNSFPMYADPSEYPSNYLIVADGEGKALDVKRHTGLSSAKVKKIYTERLNRTSRKHGVEAEDASESLRKEVFAETMRQLREAAVKRKRPLPEVVRITDMLIYQEESTFREVPQLLGEG
ncbi:MAG: hypothetical protein ACAI34_10505 [Verrucomicrobium sp.]